MFDLSHGNSHYRTTAELLRLVADKVDNAADESEQLSVKRGEVVRFQNRPDISEWMTDAVMGM